MAHLARSPLSATQALERPGLLSLPNEILLDIISYLQSTDNPVTYLEVLVFRPYCPYYVDTSRSYILRSLTQTCRRSNIVTELILSNDRKLERDTLEECRAMAHWLTSCQSGSRTDVESWLRSRPANWKPPKWGKEVDEEWNFRREILRLEVDASRDDDAPLPAPNAGQPDGMLLG